VCIRPNYALISQVTRHMLYCFRNYKASFLMTGAQWKGKYWGIKSSEAWRCVIEWLVLSKHCKPLTQWHSVTFQKTWILKPCCEILTAAKENININIGNYKNVFSILSLSYMFRSVRLEPSSGWTFLKKVIFTTDNALSVQPEYTPDRQAETCSWESYAWKYILIIV